MVKQLKIFLATDYSEAAVSAERYAVELAKNTNSLLTILHVYEIPFNFPSERSAYAKATETLRKNEMLHLERHLNTLFDSLGIHSSEVNFECIVMEGTVGKQIRKEAEQLNMDIVVVGTHGATGFRKFFLGSHTWDVIKSSNVPVLAIPKDATYTPVKNIVFATDYREGEAPGVRFLLRLSKQFDATFTMLHIMEDPFSKSLEAAALEKFKARVQDHISPDKLDLRIVQSKDLISALNNFCETAKTDWLAMSHEKPSFFENLFLPSKSATKEMSFHTHIPLLAIPDFYMNAPEVSEEKRASVIK